MSRKSSQARTYRRWIEELLDAGNYFQFFRHFLAVMTPTEAVLIQSLLNLGRHRNADGWIEATAEYIEETLHLSCKQSEYTIRKLAGRGFVSTKRVGMPPHRHVRINVETILKAVNNVNVGHRPIPESLGNQFPKNNQHKGTTIVVPNKPITVGGTGGPTAPAVPADGARVESNPTPQQRRTTKRTPPRSVQESTNMLPLTDALISNHTNAATKQYDPATYSRARARAERLNTAVKRRIDLASRRINTSKSVEWLLKLEEEIGNDRLGAAFEWYLKHIHEEYVPQAWCGKAFRDKFAAVEAAMARHRKRNPDVAVSDTARRIAEKLVRYESWKIDTTQLPVAVEMSLRNVTEFRNAARLFSERYPNSRVGRFAARVANRLSNVEHFVREHFIAVAEWATSKNGLLKMVIDDKHLDGLVWDWSREFCGDGSVWESLAKEIGFAE